MNPEAPTLVEDVDSGSSGKHAFVWHFFDMLPVMFAGMASLSGLVAHHPYSRSHRRCP